MSARETTGRNAALALEVEELRLKAQKVLYERMARPDLPAAELKLLAESASLMAWAGQPGRQERPGP